jgi:valyl-tRNA synthetase
MIIYNPQDKRYTHLEGKTAISPLFNKEIKIKAHPFAQIDKGSGLVMMCSAGDLTDIQFFREQKIKPIISINKDGRMNSHAEFLEGLKVKEARQKILDLLKEKNLLKKQTPIKHRTPVSERSGAEIEFIEMPEFYLKQLDFKKDIERISKKINFYPEDSKKILDAWIKSVSIDWPISRRRYYATPIPLWHSKNKTVVPAEGKYYQPWKESPPLDSQVIEKGKIVGKVKDFPEEIWIGEERVLDTWFDSSISELVMLKYKENAETFKKSFPATLRPQGKEIVRTWLYYTILRGFLETKSACFEDVWIHNHILDEKGRKMSKSLGNSIDPQQLIKEFGAEALRLWSATEGDLSKQDFMCSKEKIRGEVKTLNKLLNITKFIQQFDKPKKQPKLNSLDSLFISYIDNLTFLAKEDYKNYNFFHPAVRQRQFLWDHLASHYIELVKNRCYNEQKTFTKEESDSAKYTLYYLLENLSLLMYPIIPQITSLILEELGFKLKELEFPIGKKDKTAEKIIESIKEFNSEIWKKKKESNLTLKDPLENIKIPKFLDSYKKDLIACHNLK